MLRADAVRRTVQDIPRCSAQPDRARPRLAVRQIELPLAVEAPLEGQNFRLAAPCEEKEPDSRRVKRTIRLVTVQDPGEAAVFFGRQKSLGSCLSIAAYAPAGVAVLGAVTPGFRLLHDDGQDRRGTVRRRRCRVERAKPEHQIIVATEVGPQVNDQGQLVGLLDGVNETLLTAEE